MSYVPLGSRSKAGTSAGGQDWVITFGPADLHISSEIQWFECYKFVVAGTEGSTFTVEVDGAAWDVNTFGQANALDMVQPLLLTAGQSLTFGYTYAAPGTPPQATIWLRYDPALLPSRVRAV